MQQQHITNTGILFAIGILSSVLVVPINLAEGKVNQNKCIAMYERYKELGEQKFREKYSYKSGLYECIKLYKNPDWYFVGKSKIDKNFEKIQSSFKNGNDDKVNIKVTSTTLLGKEKYLVKFQACSEKSIQKPSFLIESRIDKFIAESGKSLHAGKCQSYHTQINSKDTEQIKIKFVSDHAEFVNVKYRKI